MPSLGLGFESLYKTNNIKCFSMHSLVHGLFKAPWCLRSTVEVAGPPNAALH